MTALSHLPPLTCENADQSLGARIQTMIRVAAGTIACSDLCTGSVQVTTQAGERLMDVQELPIWIV